MARRSGALDTNVLLDWLLDRDQKRSGRIEHLLKTDARFLVCDVVVFELVYTLKKYYDLTRIEVARNVAVVLNNPRIDCNRYLLLRAITQYASRPSLSFADCYALEAAENEQAIPLWTFDAKLVKHSAGRARLLK